MTTWWRSASCLLAASAACGSWCAAAVAKAPACDAAAVTTALRQTVLALNGRNAPLLARTYERLPTRIGPSTPITTALRIARAGHGFATVPELSFQPGKTTARRLAIDLARVAALGRWKLDDVELGARKPGAVGIGAYFVVARRHSTLRYYGEGGFDCRTGRIFAFAPLRQ